MGNKPYVVSIVGHDNSGKSTIAKMVSDAMGYELISFPNEELYSGKVIREILNKKRKFEPVSFQALQHSNKMETYRRLDPTKKYVTDRGKLCEIVYGLADGSDRAWVFENASDIPDPDITFLLVGASYGNDGDIYSDDDYQKKIKQLYLEESFGLENVFCINNTRKLDGVFGRIMKILMEESE